jgi:hypothetical protein
MPPTIGICSAPLWKLPPTRTFLPSCPIMSSSLSDCTTQFRTAPITASLVAPVVMRSVLPANSSSLPAGISAAYGHPVDIFPPRRTFVRFGSSLMQPGFLKASSLKLLFTSQNTVTNQPTQYGLGWMTLGGLRLHGGDTLRRHRHIVDPSPPPGPSWHSPSIAARFFFVMESPADECRPTVPVSSSKK